MEKKYYVGFNKFESQASNEIFPHMGPSWVLKLAYGSMHPVHGEPGGTSARIWKPSGSSSKDIILLFRRS